MWRGTFRNLLVSKKTQAFLNMPQVGGNADGGQSQGSFRGHSRNFQTIKILRLQLRDELLDRLTCGPFFVRTKGVRSHTLGFTGTASRGLK
jgi:hypothetical protein